MSVQEPLYWVNDIPIYPQAAPIAIQTLDNTPDTINALGDLKINSLVFDNPSDVVITSGSPPYTISTSGTSYITLTADQAVTTIYNIDNFEVTFDAASPAAKILLVLFSSGTINGGLKIVANQLLKSGNGAILLKDDEDIVVDPTDGNGYNRASILFVSDGINWMELNRFLYVAV